MTDWDDDIVGLPLSDVEKNGLQVFRNYSRAFHRKKVEEAKEKAAGLTFDVEGLRGDIAALVTSPVELALLSACSIADDLLKDMFKRLEKPGLKVAEMVSPLGPLSDLNRRLKVAALADFIDQDDFGFFDGIRKLRNKVAHGRRAQPPTTEAIAKLIDEIPYWLDAIAPSRAEAKTLPPSTVESLFKAGLAVHLSKLALNTLYGPLAKSLGVQVHQLIESPNSIAFEISGVGMATAVEILEQGLGMKTVAKAPGRIERGSPRP